MTNKKKKIIWPFSPYDTQEKSEKTLKSFFKKFSNKYEIEIQPVYVVSSHFYSVSEYFESVNTEDLIKYKTKDCIDYIKENYSEIDLLEPVVLKNSFSSQSAEVAIFCDYVTENKPDFVVLSSHGREGWSRAFLGSFAENFLLHSRVPTIVLGPECSDIEDLNRAIMPIQLSDSSYSFVEKFLDDHRLSFLSDLTLFHKISMVDIEEIAWAPGLYGLADFSSDDLLKKARFSTREYLSSFLDHPLSQKRLNYLISEKTSSVGSVIVEEASAQKFDLIVMRTESGTLEANLIGSITRDVIRHAKQPVVVYPHLFPLKE